MKCLHFLQNQKPRVGGHCTRVSLHTVSLECRGMPPFTRIAKLQKFNRPRESAFFPFRKRKTWLRVLKPFSFSLLSPLLFQFLLCFGCLLSSTPPAAVPICRALPRAVSNGHLLRTRSRQHQFTPAVIIYAKKTPLFGCLSGVPPSMVTHSMDIGRMRVFARSTGVQNAGPGVECEKKSC